MPSSTEEHLLPNNVAYYPPGKESLQRDFKNNVFLGEKVPHWENHKLLPFNNSSDIYHISLSAFVARKLRAGSHDPQEQLVLVSMWWRDPGTRGQGCCRRAGGRGQVGASAPVPLQLPLAECRVPSHFVCK